LAAAAVILLFAGGFGCGGDTPASGGDMAVGKDMAVFSVCGHPGDVGNSLGVGKYCMKIADCLGNSKATLCSTLGSDNAFFCTMTCTPPANDMGSTECGENAICQCGSGSAQSGCGCYPTSCTQ
jgi:hypothetical protein